VLGLVLHSKLGTADDITELGGNVYNIKKNVYTLIAPSKEADIEANNDEDILYMCSCLVKKMQDNTTISR
jgi:hypothetical protein